jgi:vancomycin permeability regulator SanA
MGWQPGLRSRRDRRHRDDEAASCGLGEAPVATSSRDRRAREPCAAASGIVQISIVPRGPYFLGGAAFAPDALSTAGSTRSATDWV